MNYELKRVKGGQGLSMSSVKTLALTVLATLARVVSAKGMEAMCKAMCLFGMSWV